MLRRPLATLAVALALAAGSTSAFAQVGTAFTYQGQLKSAGSNVNSATDIQFSLWTLAIGGTQVGSTVTQTSVSVAQGLFTTTVDFGVSPYTSSQALYLQIAVRNPAGTGSFVPMGSRQQLTAAPFSMATRGINVDGSGNAVIGAASAGTSPGRFVAQGAWTTGSGKVVLNPTNWGPSGTSGDGAGVISITDGNGGERAFLGVSGGPTVDTVLAGTGGGTQLRLSSGSAGIGFYPNTGLGAFSGNRGTPAMLLSSGGFLGVGTDTPVDRLSIVGGAISFGGTSLPLAGMDYDSGSDALRLRTNIGGAGLNTTAMAISRTLGNVGIGVAAPAARLDVRLPNNNAGAAIVFGSQVYAMGRLGEDASTNTVIVANAFPTGASPVSIDFRIGGTAAANTKARVRDDGVFEVKTLQINGGSDLVEGFNSHSTDLDPGTLMVIDPAHPGELMPSTSAYDSKVAGIVSGAGGVNPGIKMGQDGKMDGKNPIAMTGRVYVKCSAANGAIQPGDLLTTSDLPGHAMKASDRSRAPGAVIGKAMSALDKDTGLVLVLVNLQ